MLIAWCVAMMLGAPQVPATNGDPAASAPAAQQPAATPKAAKKPKKPKKKKVPKETEPAPDEPVDPDTIERGGGVRFTWKQHPSIRFGNALRIDFEAKFQEDGHSSYGPVQGLNTWELHRNRVGIKGNVYKDLEYEVEYELTEKELTDHDILLGYTPNSQWKDVYVNLTYVKNAQIKIGKFKIPFGLDQLTGVTHNDFIYRSLGASYLAPARDIGAMVHGSFLKHGFTYATGVFMHDGDNARSKKIQGGDETFAGRVTATPFRLLGSSPFSVVEVGTAFAISNLTDDSFRPNGLRGRTVLTQDTFFEPVYVKGHRRRWEADVDWTVGPASLRTEYTHVSDDRLAQGIGDQDLTDAVAHSWYVSGTWALTGEDKRRPLKAANPLFQGGIGAVEVAARYERAWFDSAVGNDAPFRNPRAETILPAADRALTLGLNWTLNRFVKIQVNGIREHVEDPDRNPVPNGAAFWSRVLRLQFVL
jgi:phosphate-selective porin OprO/OprP